MNKFQDLCKAHGETIDLTEETVFGITIPDYARTIAAGFRQDTVAPTTNATLERK